MVRLTFRWCIECKTTRLSETKHLPDKEVLFFAHVSAGKGVYYVYLPDGFMHKDKVLYH